MKNAITSWLSAWSWHDLIVFVCLAAAALFLTYWGEWPKQRPAKRLHRGRRKLIAVLAIFGLLTNAIGQSSSRPRRLQVIASCSLITNLPSFLVTNGASIFAAPGDGLGGTPNDGYFYLLKATGSSGTWANKLFRFAFAHPNDGGVDITGNVLQSTYLIGGPVGMFPNGNIILPLTSATLPVAAIQVWNGSTSSPSWSTITGFVYGSGSQSSVPWITNDSAGYTYLQQSWTGDLWRNDAPNSINFTRVLPTTNVLVHGATNGGIYRLMITDLHDGQGENFYVGGEQEGMRFKLTPHTLTGTTVNASTAVTLTAGDAAVVNDLGLYATNFSPLATVASISGTSLTLSLPATSSATVTITAFVPTYIQSFVPSGAGSPWYQNNFLAMDRSPGTILVKRNFVAADNTLGSDSLTSFDVATFTPTKHGAPTTLTNGWPMDVDNVRQNGLRWVPQTSKTWLYTGSNPTNSILYHRISLDDGVTWSDPSTVGAAACGAANYQFGGATGPQRILKRITTAAGVACQCGPYY